MVSQGILGSTCFDDKYFWQKTKFQATFFSATSNILRSSASCHMGQNFKKLNLYFHLKNSKPLLPMHPLSNLVFWRVILIKKKKNSFSFKRWRQIGKNPNCGVKLAANRSNLGAWSTEGKRQLSSEWHICNLSSRKTNFPPNGRRQMWTGEIEAKTNGRSVKDGRVMPGW